MEYVKEVVSGVADDCARRAAPRERKLSSNPMSGRCMYVAGLKGCLNTVVALVTSHREGKRRFASIFTFRPLVCRE